MRAFWELVIRFFSNVLALILVGLQGSPLKVLRFSSNPREDPQHRSMYYKPIDCI
jgi:hypothetical protein